MIRILQVGLTANRGGTEMFVMNVYRSIDRNRIQFDFLVEYGKILPFADEIIALGGHIYPEYFYIRERWKKEYQSIASFFDQHPEIDGVHVHANGMSTTFRVLEEAARRKLPIRILHSHSSGNLHPYTIREKLYDRYARIRQGRIVTKRLACSVEAGRWLFGEKTNFEVVNNAIWVERFRFDKDKRAQMRKELQIEEKELVMGFVGGFHPIKDPEYLLRVFAIFHRRNPDSCLLMLGQGKLFALLQQQICSEKLSDRVICPGNVANVWDYMQAMDVFILPSVFEGFGMALLEAQAAGLGCITTKGAVPQRVNVTGHVSYLPKENREEEWAVMAENLARNGRYNGQIYLRGSTFDLCNLGKQMDDIYLSRIAGMRR